MVKPRFHARSIFIYNIVADQNFNKKYIIDKILGFILFNLCIIVFV